MKSQVWPHSNKIRLRTNKVSLCPHMTQNYLTHGEIIKGVCMWTNSAHVVGVK